jgi:hypothetical protein
MLERLANHSFCYLDGYSGYHQILIHPDYQSKTIFTCSYGTFAYRQMLFGLCNAPASFQRSMMAIFSNWLRRSWRCLWMISLFMAKHSRVAWQTTIKCWSGVKWPTLSSTGRSVISWSKKELSLDIKFQRKGSRWIRWRLWRLNNYRHPSMWRGFIVFWDMQGFIEDSFRIFLRLLDPSRIF